MKIKTITSIAIFFLMASLVNVWSQTTSRFTTTLRNSAGAVIIGRDVELRLSGVLQYQLAEILSAKGSYFNDTVLHGVYQLYVDGVQSTVSPTIFHGAQQISNVVNHFDASGDVGAVPTFSVATQFTAVNVKITGGSPGTGKVLTSDADGDATWQTGGGGGPSDTWQRVGTEVELVNVGDSVAIGNTNATEKLHVFSTTTATNILVETQNTNGLATAGITLKKDDSSPGANDFIGGLSIVGNNSTPASFDYAAFITSSPTVTAGSEDGKLSFFVALNGNPQGFLVIDGSTNEVEVTAPDFNVASIETNTNILIENTNTSNLATATLQLYHNDSSPIADQALAGINFQGNNSTPALFDFAAIAATSPTVTAGNEDGRLVFLVGLNGTPTNFFELDGGTNQIEMAAAKIGVNTATPDDFFHIRDTNITTVLTVENENTSNLATANVAIYKDDSNPTANNLLAAIGFQGNNSTPARFGFASIAATSPTVTAGAEDGKLAILVAVNGNGDAFMTFDGENNFVQVNKPLQIPTGASNGFVLTSDASGNATWQAPSGGSSEWTDTGAILHPNESTVDEIAIGGTTEAGADIFLGVDGFAHFNKQQTSTGDFQVFGQTIAQMIFVDASTNTISIGGAPTQAFATLSGAYSELSPVGLFINSNLTMNDEDGVSTLLQTGGAGSSITISNGLQQQWASSARFEEPGISITSGSLVRSAVVYIGIPATEATDDYSLYVDGLTHVQGVISTSGSFALPDGVRQTFNPNGTTPGLNVGAHTADPSTPTNGDVYYNSTANELRARINSAWIALSSGGGAGDITDVGPAFTSGAAFTDGAVTSGTTMLVWEGTTINTNELSILAPTADPGADIDITFPSATGTLTTRSDNLGVFASTTSAQLATVLNDEIGVGEFLLDESPTITTPTIVGAISLPDGVRQTFNPDGTIPGINIGSFAGNPSTPSDGDMWYNTSTQRFMARENSANVTMITNANNVGVQRVGTKVSLINTGDQVQFGDITTFTGKIHFNHTASSPVLLLENFSETDAHGAELVLIHNETTANAGEEAGIITFRTMEGSSVVDFGSIALIADDVGGGTGDGHFEFSARTGGAIEKVLNVFGTRELELWNNDNANGTTVGQLDFNGINSTPAQVDYASIRAISTSISGYNADLSFYTALSGSLTEGFRIGGTTATFFGSIDFPDGVRQIFNPNGVTAGLNAGTHNADPSAPSDADIYYNTTANELRARINGTWVALGAGGSGAPTGVNYLVGTADGTLTNEIVVGTTPGGELGGSWASPTIDADAVALNEIGDPSANSTIALATNTLTLTTTLDAASISTFTITNTDADAANTSPMIDLRHNDAADAQVIYLRMVSDQGGGAADDYIFSQTAATFDLPLVIDNITLGATITFPDNVRQTFNPGTANSGVNVGAHTADPSTPSNGDLYYNSTANEMRARINGAWVALGAGGGSGDITDVGPAFASGAAFTDGAVSTGTNMLIWEGTSADANELTLISPSSNPGADINLTLPSATGNILMRTGTITNGGLLLGTATDEVRSLGVASNGQIPIGDGTTDPVLATITGTAQEITVTNASGSITLSVPDVFQEIFIPVGFVNPGAGDLTGAGLLSDHPDNANDFTLDGIDLSGTAEGWTSTFYPMPPDWNGSTAPKFKIVSYSGSSHALNTANYEMRTGYVRPGTDSWIAALGSLEPVNQTYVTANVVYESSTISPTPAGTAAAGAWIKINTMRDGDDVTNDTFNNVTVLVGYKMRYLKNIYGTTTDF